VSGITYNLAKESGKDFGGEGDEDRNAVKEG
jgi:hypothetical protein